MHFLLILEKSKIYIKTYNKIAATCFGLRPSSGSLQLSVAEVTLTLKQSVKLRRYVLCGGVAAWYGVCAVCCVPCAVCCVLCAVYQVKKIKNSFSFLCQLNRWEQN
jgi:hypothetical protein